MPEKKHIMSGLVWGADAVIAPFLPFWAATGITGLLLGLTACLYRDEIVDLWRRHAAGGDVVRSADVKRIKVMRRSEYDALDKLEPHTAYMIKADDEIRVEASPSDTPCPGRP